MATGEIRQISAEEVAVPLVVWQRVEMVLAKFTRLEEICTRLDAIEALQVTNSEFMSRAQAMQYLHVKSTKLWELTTSGAIETSRATGKILYKTQSCKEFLLAQGYSQEHVQARFREILRMKQKK